MSLCPRSRGCSSHTLNRRKLRMPPHASTHDHSPALAMAHRATLGARVRRAFGYLLLTRGFSGAASYEEVAHRALGARAAARRKDEARRSAERILSAERDCENDVRGLTDRVSAYVGRSARQHGARLQCQI